MFNHESTASIQTRQLHQRLNGLYSKLRDASSERRRLQFDVLWDLKELALLEQRQLVEIPATWLDELEHFARNEEMKAA